jgi:hypothetical protein
MTKHKRLKDNDAPVLKSKPKIVGTHSIQRHDWMTHPTNLRGKFQHWVDMLNVWIVRQSIQVEKLVMRNYFRNFMDCLHGSHIVGLRNLFSPAWCIRHGTWSSPILSSPSPSSSSSLPLLASIHEGEDNSIIPRKNDPSLDGVFSSADGHDEHDGDSPLICIRLCDPLQPRAFLIQTSSDTTSEDDDTNSLTDEEEDLRKDSEEIGDPKHTRSSSVTPDSGDLDRDRRDDFSEDDDIFVMEDWQDRPISPDSPLLCHSPRRVKPSTLQIPSTHCIAVDWDDTLMASSALMAFLTAQDALLKAAHQTQSSPSPVAVPVQSYPSIPATLLSGEFTQRYAKALDLLEKRIILFLEVLRRLGDVFIITNSEQGWVQLSCERYIPSVWKCLQEFPIISARTNHEKVHPGNPYMWKYKAFQECVRPHHKYLMSFGDSPVDHQVAEDVGKLCQLQVKNIKFKLMPSFEDLNLQLSHILTVLSTIHQSVEAMTVIACGTPLRFILTSS